MEPKKILKEVAKLELAEKIMLVEDIWNSIAMNNAKLPMPEWQKLELERRYDEYKDGKLELHNWKTIHEDIRRKYQ